MPLDARAPTLGLCQWFHFEAYEDVETVVALLRELGVRRLRTGVSWADYHRPGGRAWYDWQFAALAEAGLELLVSVWHTPPSRSEGKSCSAPPRVLRDYADFIDLLAHRYAEAFDTVELWNEPNNAYKWDFARFDPDWRKFDEMIGSAAYWARRLGLRTVLGGIIPIDRDWLERRAEHGVLADIDVVAVHGFPHMWWDDAPSWERREAWRGWRQKLEMVRPVAAHRPVWVTETGLATWDGIRERPAHLGLQIRMLEEAVSAPVERLYWYSLVDLHPERPAIEGFHVDEHEYHMGLVTHRLDRKPAFYRLRELVREEAVPV